MDLRVKKTKQEIQNALLDLLDSDNSFESITVSQITRRANISRSTFYDHYSDKYALLDALYDEVAEQFNQITEAYFSTKTRGYRLDLANKILEYVLENARLFRLLLSGHLSPKNLHRILDEILIPRCMEYLSGHPNRFKLDNEFVSYIYSGIIYICLQWVAEHQNPEDLSKIIELSSQVGRVFNENYQDSTS